MLLLELAVAVAFVDSLLGVEARFTGFMTDLLRPLFRLHRQYDVL